tara:strand:+ start:1385 stop:1570 length:186 start_codon:yes stop_codon:yes gene_type:complete
MTKFAYTVIVPDFPLGQHEHFTNDLETAQKSADEWASDYGSASVLDVNLNQIYHVNYYESV